MEDFDQVLKKEFGEEIEYNVELKKFTSLNVGGPANYFYRAKKIDDLIRTVNVAYEHNVPYLVLGGGYNVVPSDNGFVGLVIKNECENIAFSGETSQVIVDSGLAMGKLINYAASRDLGGLEFLFGVPGTVGGAVYGNAGAFTYEIADFVRSVTLLMPGGEKLVIVKKSSPWMEFEYRGSKLKRDFLGEKFKPVILTVKLQLVRRRRDEILGTMQANLREKSKAQPLNEKSAGSFFKNIDKSKERSAGYLLDKSGAKRMRVGGAAFSKKHANFLINDKNATATDVRRLADKAREVVRDKFKLELEEEVEYIGKW